MLDDILEFVLEIVLDGMLEAASSVKVPIVVRILLGAILLVFYFAVFALLFMVAVQSESILLFGMSLALFVGLGVLIFRKVKGYWKQAE